MRVERCPKCEGEMEEGFLLDRSHNAFRVAQWAEGAPAFWFFQILKMGGRRRIPVRTLRCRRCGFLESFAPAR